MAFMSSQQLLATPAPPLPANVTAAQGALMRATGGAIRNRLRSAPLAFIRRATPALAAVEVAQLAYDVWQQWSLLDLPVQQQPAGIPIYPAGTQVGIYIQRRIIRNSDGVVIVNDVGTPDGSPTGRVTFTAPLQIFAQMQSGSQGGRPTQFIVVQDGSSRGEYLSAFSDSNSGFSILQAFTYPLSNPSQRVYPSPFFQPFPVPTEAPSPNVPIVVPVPVTPPFFPVPFTQPLYIPEPYNLPYSPVPLLPGTPEVPERDAPFPPAWIVPGGIEFGPPGPGSIVQVPPGYPITVTPPAVQEQTRRVPPMVTVCLDTPEPPQDCCDCEEIRQIVIEELDEKFPPRRPTTERSVATACAQSDIVVLPRFTRAVRIVLCDIPEDARTQSGVDAPDVLYAGWYSFGSVAGGDRHPIQYEDMEVYPPSEALSISYTVYTGFTARVIITYLEESS